MASFNGFDLGFIFQMPVAANPKARQINAYAGANGLEVIDHGSRGGTTFVEGAFGSSTTAGLSAVEQGMRSLMVDGRAYILVDTLGKSWPGVILVKYQPIGPIRPTFDGILTRRYEAEFLHVF